MPVIRSRPLPAREIELQVGRALEHRNGLGDAGNLSLTDTSSYHAVFKNVSGLKAGSPVRIAGVDVGMHGARRVCGQPVGLAGIEDFHRLQRHQPEKIGRVESR